MSKDLVQIIRDNPGCVAVIDNDFWSLERDIPIPDDIDTWTVENEDRWYKGRQLANSYDEFVPMDGYNYMSGNCHGGDILVALSIIAGIRVESV